MNTEIAVLNKINAANIVALRNTQDTNKLLVTGGTADLQPNASGMPRPARSMLTCGSGPRQGRSDRNRRTPARPCWPALP